MATIEPNENDQSVPKRRYVDEQTDKRMHEHLANEHDEITEEDISNIKTDFDYGAPALDGEEPTEDSTGEDDDEKILTKKVENNDDPSIDTSWNVIDA
jgi:hypothetical protein